MNNSFKTICNDLISLGLNKGDSVIVHSSLSSMGYVEGGAQTVIDALTEVVGEEGTVLFPAFTYSTAYADSEFSVNDTPVCIGKIAETFRHNPGVLRSFHPTHSVCARGKHAADFVKNHGEDDTPMGVNSPYRKLPAYKAKILLLGCSTKSNSFLHALEEVADACYALTDSMQTYKMTDENGNVTMKGIHRHNFVRPEGKIVQRYDRAIDVLNEGTDYFVGEIHGAVSYLFRSEILQEKAVAKMKTDTFFFVDVPEEIAKFYNTCK
ncbi:MAG: AAC(3) family N-acetyltransferase [Ruminococcaceae bacterium]|nr:AAC(3) family N-acetyltransferase [Oscillospiraceae bacterium]